MIRLVVKNKKGSVLADNLFDSVEQKDKWLADWMKTKSYDSEATIELIDIASTDEQIEIERKLTDTATLNTDIKVKLGKKGKSVAELEAIIDLIVKKLGL